MQIKLYGNGHSCNIPVQEIIDKYWKDETAPFSFEMSTAIGDETIAATAMLGEESPDTYPSIRLDSRNARKNRTASLTRSVKTAGITASSTERMVHATAIGLGSMSDRFRLLWKQSMRRKIRLFSVCRSATVPSNRCSICTTTLVWIWNPIISAVPSGTMRIE